MGNYLGVAGSITGLMVLFGAAYAVFTSAKTSKLLELSSREAEAERQRGDRLERDNQELSRRVEVLESTNKLLVETVSGETAIRELEQSISQWRREHVSLLNSLIDKETAQSALIREIDGNVHTVIRELRSA